MNAHELPLAPLVRGRVAPLSSLRQTLDIDALLERWCDGQDLSESVSLTEQLRDHLRGPLAEGLACVLSAGPTGVHVALACGGGVITRPRTSDEAADAHSSEHVTSDATAARCLVAASPHATRQLRAQGARAVFLGVDSTGVIRIGLMLSAQTHLPDVLPLVPDCPDLRVDSLRHMAHTLSDDDTQCALELTALAHWHEATRFCTRCAGRLVSVHCGWVLACEGCQRLEYPRQDPAMIVAITNHRGQILLAHNALWEDKRVSVLAGFVDAGEAPERAVAREIAEEVGIAVTNISFCGTQPWPFPRSLMLAYTAQVTGDDTLIPDTAEIAWAQWYDPASLEQAVAEQRIILPGVNTIAYGLISRWYGGELPTAQTTR